MAAASLCALLDRAIDYAGLFPPANLALEPALKNHAGYVRHSDAWMLGAFILPIAEFDAAAPALNQFDEEHPLRISALGSRTETSDAFLQSLAAARDAIDAFRSRFGRAAVIEQLEMALPPDPGPELFSAARTILTGSSLRLFWEAPAKSAPKVIQLIAENNRAQAGQTFGFKLRTGGVTADAFPTAEVIAAALHAAGSQSVPIKFTAGLHHPVRLFHESVQTKMYGFLNVLGAGILGSAHGWTQATIVQMLMDEDPAAFVFTDAEFRWREWKVPTADISTRRRLVTSLGSCSFDEPREDLRALKLL